MTDTDDPLSKVRSQLKERYSYLHLAIALMPDLFRQDDLRCGLADLGTFIDTARSEALLQRAAELSKRLDSLIVTTNERLHPKMPWRQIAADYWTDSADRTISLDHGISYGWLEHRFDLTAALGIPHDMPFHAHIGIGTHAGNAAVEEEFLLKDSFYVQLRTVQQFDWLRTVAARQKHSPVDDFDLLAGHLAHNVAAYARLTVKSYYAFLECFVNSVAIDFLARSSDLSPDDTECLRGYRKGRYLSLEAKLEKLPGVIRADRHRPIILSDPQQIREPFLTWRSITQVRDASMHYATYKERIWRSPEEWSTLAELAGETCLKCACVFWSACYPHRGAPAYLYGLDADRLRELTETRLRCEAVLWQQMSASVGANNPQAPHDRQS